MIRVGHLLDDTAGWEQRAALSQLLSRLPANTHICLVAALGALRSWPAEFRRIIEGRRIEFGPGFTRFFLTSVPFFSHYARRSELDVVHAWGVNAASCAMAGTQRPVVLELFDPLEAKRRIRQIRALARPARFSISCSCQTVRRRLIEGGVSPECCVVIRPGVDFAWINQWKRRWVRERLGVRDGQTLVVVPEPVTRESRSWDAFFACGLLDQLGHELRVLLPGGSREGRRIQRIAASQPVGRALLPAQTEIPYEQCLANADVLLITPRADASTTAIAWAMASQVTVIGTAVHAVAELIAHRVNGLLFKQVSGRSALPALCRLLAGALRTSHAPGSEHSNEINPIRLREVARGHAYECFGLRRMVEQHVRLYQNLIAGAPASDGITDSAIAPSA